MPVYEYKCSKCGKIFDFKQSMKDASLTKCPESVCEQEVKGEGEVSRIISGNVGLVFKGSGFYVTDYARNGNGKQKAEKTQTNGNTEKKPETKQTKKTQNTAKVKE